MAGRVLAFFLAKGDGERLPFGNEVSFLLKAEED